MKKSKRQEAAEEKLLEAIKDFGNLATAVTENNAPLIPDEFEKVLMRLDDLGDELGIDAAEILNTNRWIATREITFERTAKQKLSVLKGRVENTYEAMKDFEDFVEGKEK